jgi:hypothetical protein
LFILKLKPVSLFLYRDRGNPSAARFLLWLKLSTLKYGKHRKEKIKEKSSLEMHKSPSSSIEE